MLTLFSMWIINGQKRDKNGLLQQKQIGELLRHGLIKNNINVQCLPDTPELGTHF